MEEFNFDVNLNEDNDNVDYSEENTSGDYSGGDAYDSDSGEFFGSSDERIHFRYHVSPAKMLACLVGGILGGFMGLKAYAALTAVWKPLAVAVFFLIMALCIFLCLIAVSVKTDDYYYFTKKQGGSARFKKTVPIIFVLLFLFSGLFEFLYELEGSYTAPVPTSYIFALDTSGSMEESDPSAAEAQALSQVISQLDTGVPFAVYTFSNSAECVSQMHNKTDADNNEKWEMEYKGETAMYGVLENILEDLDNADGVSTLSGGACPRVILFSDGAPTDGGFANMSIKRIVREYEKRGISVCTACVELADVDLMTFVAESTGGKCVYINNMDELLGVMKTALTLQGDTTRTLLSHRPFMVKRTLYAVLRVVFLFLLGLSFFAVIYMANCVERDMGAVFAIKLSTALLGAGLMESLLQAFGSSVFAVQMTFVILTSFAVLHTAKPAEQIMPSVPDPDVDPVSLDDIDTFSDSSADEEMFILK